MTTPERSVVLLSGGLDSTTCLAISHSMGFESYALSVEYGQRHAAELEASKRIAVLLGAKAHRTASVNLGDFGGSALTDPSIPVPENTTETGIPVTYVPARNTIMLSMALGWAEILEARHIFIGVNAVDYSGYPDCRPAFIDGFQHLANVATKAGTEGRPITIHAPLLNLSKAEIIQKGVTLGIDYGMTISCYQADDNGHACGRCDACILRKTGFEAAGITDPTRYQA